MACRPRPRRPARLLSLVAVRAGQHDGFPRRREPRSGAVAARSIPLSPVCSGLSTVCGGELERGPPHPPINAPAPTRYRPGPPPIFPAKAGIQDAPVPSFPRRREPRSGAVAARSIPLSPVCSGPLHRLRGRGREGPAPLANQRPLPLVDRRPTPATTLAPYPKPPTPRKINAFPCPPPTREPPPPLRPRPPVRQPPPALYAPDPARFA